MEDSQYVPDFIVETVAERLLVEIKDPGEIDDAVVQGKAAAAFAWSARASAHAATYGEKRWRYLLVPDAAVTAVATLTGLSGRFAL